ncbi:MAG: TetR family transcriptional regulator [Trebonia sp.]
MSGLREYKKRHTRVTIATAAARLFAERGFAAVTVDDVARAATVSRQTVFNYFPSKESMVFDREAEIEAALVAAVRDRAAGTSPAAAFHAHTRAFWLRLGRLLTQGPLPQGFWEIVTRTPALRDHAEVINARHARAVATELARERGLSPSDPVCHGLGRALCGVNFALLVYGMDRLIAGNEPHRVIAETIVRAEQAYDLLEHGLGG